MKTIDPLPSTVDKRCGTKPGPDDTTYVSTLDLQRCGNPASYAVTIDGVEILVCGTHRKTFQENDEAEYPEVLTE